jgi:excisionase family DNA binding protein
MKKQPPPREGHRAFLGFACNPPTLPCHESSRYGTIQYIKRHTEWRGVQSGEEYRVERSTEWRGATMSTENEKITLSAQEASNLLGVSAGTVYRQAKQNKLPHLRVGDRLLIPRRELEEWIAKQAASSMDQIKPMLVSSERQKQG